MRFITEKQKLDMINKALENIMDKLVVFNPTLNEAMRYSLYGKGKRIRPILMLSVFEMLGGNLEECMPFACGLEMIHTYSLIHDDLPALDDDDFRRGIPTNHMVYGEAIALLAGSALLNLAYETMIISCDSLYKIMAVHIISSYVGSSGMIAGQAWDLEITDDNERKYMIAELKTGKLFSAALAAPCLIIKGENHPMWQQLEKIGKELGGIFQRKDDLEDLISSKDTSKEDIDILKKHYNDRGYANNILKSLKQYKDSEFLTEYIENFLHL